METTFSKLASNADNSYFSVSAIMAKVSEYITSDATLKDLEEILTGYYIPAFLITVTANALTISVYPLIGSEATININRVDGASIEVVVGSQDTPSSTDPELYEDISPTGSIYPVKLNPDVHKDSAIKQSAAAGDLGLDDSNVWKTNFMYSPIETIFLTQISNSSKELCDTAKANLQIINDIVSSRIKSFDSETQEVIIAEYQKYQEVIISLSSLLTTLSINQKEFTDLLNIQALITNYLGFTSADGIDDNSISTLLEKIKNLAANESYFDFPTGLYSYPSWYHGVDPTEQNKYSDHQATMDSDGDLVLKSQIYQSSALDIASENSDQLIDTMEEKFYRRFAAEYYSLGSFEAKRTELENLEFPKLNENTIQDWYTQEMHAFLVGEDSPGLANDWVSKFKEIADPVINTMNISVAAGSGLLVRDSILKAINTMVESGIDVGEYLGIDENGNTRFDELNQDTVLGIKTVGVYPNPSREDKLQEDFVSPSQLDNKGYLNFATLIRLIRKLNPANRDSAVIPDEWWSDEGIKRWISLDILNSGPVGGLGLISNSCVNSIADSIDMVGTSKNTFAVENPLTVNSMTTPGVKESGTFYGQSSDDLPTNSSAAYNPSGLFDAKSILGINWFKETNSSSRSSEIETTQTNTTSVSTSRLHGETVINGPLNFLFSTDERVEESDVTFPEEYGPTDVATYLELEEFGSDSYFQINRFASRKIGTMWSKNGTTVNEYTHFSDWFSKIVPDDFELNTNELENSISNVSIIPTGIFGGHISLPKESTGTCTEINRLQVEGVRGRSYEDVSNDFPIFLAWKNFDPDQNLSFFDYPTNGPRNWSNISKQNKWRTTEAYQFKKKSFNLFKKNGDYREISGEDEFLVEWQNNQAAIEEEFGLTSEDVEDFLGFNLQDKGYIVPFQWKKLKKFSEYPVGGYAIDEWPLKRTQGVDFEGSITFDIAPTVDDPVWNSWFKSKGGGVLRYLGALEGIFKGLFIETVKELTKKLNESTNSSVDVSPESFMSIQVANLWIEVLFTQIDFLHDNLDSDPSAWDVVVNPDGGIGLTDILQDGQAYIGWTNYKEKRKRRSNITVNHKNLVKSYVKFKSLLSTANTVSVSNDPYKSVNPAEFLPRQIRADSSNSNYTSNLGLGTQYMSIPGDARIRDSLLFSYDEITGKSNIPDAISTPMGIIYDKSYQVWMENFASFVQVRNLVEKITDPVESLAYFLDSIEISDEQKIPYNEGLITIDDISKSQQILNSLNDNVEKYSADENGIGKFWKNISDNTVMDESFFEALDLQGGTSGIPCSYFVAFLGIKEKFIMDTFDTDTTYYIDLDYVTDGWYSVNKDIYGIHVVVDDPNGKIEKRSAIKISKGEISFCDASKSLIEPAGGYSAYQDAFISWALGVKGYRLDEAVFIDNKDQLYSDFLIENESGVFPWTKENFEKNIPVENVESIYNVSPWLFPQNYVMNVLKAREFKFVVPILVKVPPDSNNSAEGFQGNLKFKIGPAESPIWSNSN